MVQKINMPHEAKILSATPMKVRMAASLDARLSKMMYIHMGKPNAQGIDFCSNDYLSISNVGSSFHQFLQSSELMNTPMPTSSTGSRLLSGNSLLSERLEKIAAEYHNGEAALLFNSGFDANLALLSCILAKEDCFVHDELIHASMHDGMRLSRAKKEPLPFEHNSVASMRNTILAAAANCTGNIVVCVETVYSMDGDMCPLSEMLDECRLLSKSLQRDVYLIADEAHSGGIFGSNGEGFVVAKNAHNHPNLLARVMTFGKGYAAHGAVVVGSQVLKNYLHNYGRSFIFSTALAPHSVATLTEMYHFMQSEEAQRLRERMWKRVALFKELAQRHIPEDMLLPTMGDSPIQIIMVGSDILRGAALNRTLVKKGYQVYPIGPPAVPRGKERIRVIIHGGNTEEDIKGFVMTVSDFLRDYEG